MNLTNVKGIGPKLNEVLTAKGITTLDSLIFTFPKSYEIYKLTGFDYFNEFNLKATIISEFVTKKLKNGTITNFEVIIDDLKYKCSIFNMNYVTKVFKIGSEIVIIGSWNEEFKGINVSKIIKATDYKEGIVPIYNIEGIPNPKFNSIVKEALNAYSFDESIIPNGYFTKHGFYFNKELLYMIHFPTSISDYQIAINSLKYYELLDFSLKLELIRKNRTLLRNEPKNYDLEKLKDFITLSIHFDLTDDQKKAVNDICKYLKSDIPLNMLLEGDTGSGKTIVALIVSYAVYTSGYQTIIMVPTESLARQHYNTFKNYLMNFNVNVSLLTSSVSLKDRKTILEDLKNGKIDIIIGTQSLLNDEVVFKKLGFVVCDEQHKFGVIQRKKLSDKGLNPDTLYMTATPIPRTLALTVYNDMTLESIKTSPKNRKNVSTFIHTYKDYLKVLEFTKGEINDGRQAYFVASCIDDNPDTEVTSAIKIKEDLVKYFKSERIGLLHGKMSEIEKENVLSNFMNHDIDILVSTTVVEVGIDNPNASIMVIIDADRFGLSTLHQLRGRVGRGDYNGYAFLMVSSKDMIDRIKILEETNDGFIISEADLKERGPGDFLGVNQSGMFKFKYADLFKDEQLLLEAKKDSKELILDKRIKEYYSKLLYSDKFN